MLLERGSSLEQYHFLPVDAMDESGASVEQDDQNENSVYCKRLWNLIKYTKWVRHLPLIYA